jgi:hypothetical protein
MLEWKPKRLLGVVVGCGAMLAIVLIDVLLLHLLRTSPISIVSFILGLWIAISAILLSVLGYLLYGLLTLRYLIGRDGLVISWARRQETIPLTAIESIVPVADLGDRIKARGLCWPGHCVGRGQGDRGQEVWFYSTGRRAEELLISTPALSYVISPSNSTGLLAALRARRRLGPAGELSQTRTERGLVGLEIWRDWTALGLAAAGAIANVGLFAYIALRFPSWPELVPLLSEAGQVTLIGSKEELFELPVLGLTVLIANTVLGFVVHRWERLATYLLGSIALLVQILCWMAVISVSR